MLTNTNLNVVFNYKVVHDESGKNFDTYNIVVLFTDYSFVEESIKESIYMKKYSQIDTPYMCFKTLESMMSYIEDLLLRLELEEALVLSTTDYNIGLESAHHQRDIREIFRRFGTSVGLQKQRRNTLFSKIFR